MPPDFLLLMADQLTAGVLAAYGGRARTPHIDALANRGVVFDSFYCNSPLCAPSRFSFMAGQLPSRIGAYDNAAEFPAQAPTFAHYLRRAGYQTALSGKMHFCGPDQLHGFEDRLTTDIYPADFGWTPDWSRSGERPGWYHTMDSVTQAGPCVRTNQVDYDDEVVGAARQKLFDIARSRDRRPFCMVVSMTHPHDPYVIPQEYWDRYRDEEIELPRVGAAEAPDEPHSRRLRHVIGLGEQAPDERQVRAARRAYLGAVSYVDDQVGVLMAALRAARLDGNTIVMLFADHGDMLGERGLWFKMNFFEPACRIPLIACAPGRFAPRRVADHASLVDLLPTLLDLGGLSDPDYAEPVDGHSLAPLLMGRAPPGKAELPGEATPPTVYGEYLAEGAIAPVVMIRRGKLKFVHSPPDPDQLYDLEADPLELRNLATAVQQSPALAPLRAEVAQRWSLPRLHQEVLASQRRRRLVYAALRTGRYRAWDFQPLRDASRLYVRNDQELNDLEALARFPPAGAREPG
jgi:choline-sulfatase